MKWRSCLANDQKSFGHAPFDLAKGLINKLEITVEVSMQPFFRFLLCLCLILAATACADKRSGQEEGYTDAVDIKLQCRELADQMLATVPNNALQGYVAMPISFVNQNNTQSSSPLGRLLGESMFYEFNQRGFPTREYRLTGKIDVVGGKNDLALAANQLVPYKGQKWAALLVGTYYVDKDATFVNARLVRASDGLVLRTGELVLRNTPVLMRMAGYINGDMSSGSVPIIQGK